MKERPIIFSDAMVRAIQEGRKTQTRRVVQPQPPDRCMELRRVGPNEWAEFYNHGKPSKKFPILDKGLLIFARHRCPYGAVGDRLWVKENLWVSDCGQYFARPLYFPGSYPAHEVLAQDGSCVWTWTDKTPGAFADPHMVVEYSHIENNSRPAFRLTFSDHDTATPIIPFTGNTVLRRYTATFRKRRSARFMPRWASRITLRNIVIRAERLQDITEADAIAECITRTGEWWDGAPHPVKGTSKALPTARAAYLDIWDHLNAKRGYPAKSNPFVWVVEFEKVSHESDL